MSNDPVYNERLNIIKDNNSVDMHTVSLLEWTGFDGTKGRRSEEELRECFLNLDKSLRYLHNNDCCVNSFDPNTIDLVDGSTNLIRFNDISRVDNSYVKPEIVKEDIFLSSCLQIGLYTHTLSKLTKDFLKNNYDEFSQYLPESDIPYYRGVIQRNASVYLCDFAVEKRNRDLISLQKELSSGDNNVPVEEPKVVSQDELCNKIVNDRLYYDSISKLKTKRFGDAAFINVLIFPTIVLGLTVAFCIISFILTLFG